MPHSTSPEERILRLTHRLTVRDHRVVRAVGTFRVLTTDHLARLFFTSSHRTQIRLKTLTSLGLLERFQPWPRAPYHYVLGELGALVVAAEAGEPDGGPQWRRDHAMTVANSQRLAHLVGVNEVATTLLAANRRRPGPRVRWWTEARCAHWCGDVVRPDGRLLYEEADVRLEAFLEFDRRTEPLERLVRQVERYRTLERERGRSAWVLFVLPSTRREHTARRALRGTDLPVATAVMPQAAHPDAPAWAPLEGTARLALLDLALEPKPAGALAREQAGGRRPGRYAARDHLLGTAP